MEAYSPEVNREHAGGQLLERYNRVRQQTEYICSGLRKEDYVVQPVVDVSPPKWHLGHSTWFFETFVLGKFKNSYQPFHPDFNFIFNSYYETIGERVLRPQRGNLSRPDTDEIYSYRKYVDEQMTGLLIDCPAEVYKLTELGLQHEQQHQELLQTDIKYILGHNPLFPSYHPGVEEKHPDAEQGFVNMDSGLYHIGYSGPGFCFDNELGFHDVYLEKYSISKSLVTNAEYIEFINAGGYNRHEYWHSEAWDLVRQGILSKPLYWHQKNGDWFSYSEKGLIQVDPALPVCHVSFYEASAFAAWRGKRLPTEFEWEAASEHFSWGQRWEWTNSAYLPYPRFSRDKGALGEYNAKFMVNQMVLRGASVATPQGHSRKTYRNFFHPYLQWQFCGIRLCG